MATHDEHRQRMKQTFTEHGLVTMHDHEALELLLYYAIPRVDVNPIAHALIRRFGTLHGVFEASQQELARVDGVGPQSALLLHLCMELFRRYSQDAAKGALKNEGLDSTEKMGAYMSPYFLGLREEIVMMACIDHKGAVLSCFELSRGSVNDASISVRRVVELAMRYNAHGVILAHNHPSGLALPSRDDMETTRLIQRGLAAVEVRLLDHIIIAEDDFVSLRDSGIVK